MQPAAGNADVLARCKVVFLAVKPQAAAAHFGRSGGSVGEEALGSFDYGRIAAVLSSEVHWDGTVSEVMPNTPLGSSWGPQE